MFKKLVKKLALAATLACVTTAVAASVSACNIETDHPEVRITIEFDGVGYELDYTLYRNMYPNTVRHFIELSENGFYTDMLIHDYRTADWLTGGFAYDELEYNTASQENAYASYLEEHSLESNYMELFEAGKLTPTVYSGSEYDGSNQILIKESALPTLIGEFKNNINQVIEKGALTAEQGVLKMYYYGKSTTGKVHVMPDNDQIIWNADYKTNCATSVFAMQVGSGSSITASDYCVFGKMESTSALIDLLNAIDDYYIDADSASGRTIEDVNVDNLVEVYSSEAADKGIEVDFTLPTTPIIVRSVKVTKY